MKTPTIQQVKEHFKDAKKVQCLLDNKFYTYFESAGAHEHDSIGSGQTHDHGDTYRPAAAVGILVHINI